MANLNINIINPTISLISRPSTSSTKCESTLEFTIKSTPFASITIVATHPEDNINKDDLRELSYDLGAGYKLINSQFNNGTSYPFINDVVVKRKTVTLNSTGEAKVRVVLANSEQSGVYYTTRVYVRDNTNNKEETKEFTRYDDSIKCRVGLEPIAVDDSVTITKGTSVNIFVLENDIRIHYLFGYNKITITSQPQHGVAELGFGGIKYIHNGNTATSDSFTYTVETPNGLSNVATVNITVEQEQKEIKADTKIIILFDNSGSMDSTLPFLQEMVSDQTSPTYTTLQETLIPHYGSKSNYDNNVKIVNMGVGDKEGERFLRKAHQSITNQQPMTDTIILAFQDESWYVYQAVPPSGINQTPNDPLVPKYAQDINDFNFVIDNYELDFNMVLFQVKIYDPSETGGAGTFYDYFKDWLIWVKNGEGSYAGRKGLSIQDNVNIRYDVDGGGQPGEASAEYYKNLIITELNNLGFNIT